MIWNKIFEFLLILGKFINIRGKFQILDKKNSLK